MKEVFEEIKEVSIIFGQALYTIREILVLVIMGVAGMALCQSKIQRLELSLLISIIVFVCIVLRRAHHAYMKLGSGHRNSRRFTSLDPDGNPVIQIEDMPEIVEYLYRLEEEQNESIVK